MTADLNRAHRVIHQLEAGICWINTWGESPAETMPVGGYKHSGINERRDDAQSYTQVKSIQVEMAKIPVHILTRRFICIDYIIIGAGSAGNVLATRLTEDPNTSGVTLKAGPDYRFDFRTQMPATLAFPLQGKRYNWAYEIGTGKLFMNNRRMECGRGKGLVDRR